MEKFPEKIDIGGGGLTRWMAEARNPEFVGASVGEHLKRQHTSLPGRTTAIPIRGGATPESISQVTNGVKGVLEVLRQEKKGFLITSPAVQGYLIEKAGRSYKDWKELNALDGDKSVAITAIIDEGMRDASWRETAKDMKAEAMELEESVFLIRETFTAVGSTGSEQPLSGKFYLVKTG